MKRSVKANGPSYFLRYVAGLASTRDGAAAWPAFASGAQPAGRGRGAPLRASGSPQGGRTGEVKEKTEQIEGS